MKKLIAIMILITICSGGLGTAFSNDFGGHGPAPSMAPGASSKTPTWRLPPAQFFSPAT